MEALIHTLSEYIDCLVLGAVALAALSTPFGLRPLADGWGYLNGLVKDSGTSVQGGLIAGVLVALLYFSGYLLSAVGASFIYPAHVSIVDMVARFNPNETGDTSPGLKPAFFQRVIPVVGPLLSRPEGPELKNYWRDAKRQTFWQVCDQKSADELLGGSVLKELRLLRGVIGLAQILLPVSLICLFLARPLQDYRLWSLYTFAATLSIYTFLIIPSYSLIEYDTHVTIWVTFPAELDKDSDKITADKDNMDQLLPCQKMKIIAKQNKES